MIPVKEMGKGLAPDSSILKKGDTRMNRKYCLFTSISFILVFFSIALAQGPLDEERAEKTTEVKKLSKPQAPFKLVTQAAVFGGYDTNARLTPTNKGDIFEETLFNLDFSKTLNKNLRFTFDYDLDFINYNKYTDVTNLLNHFRFGLHQKIFSSFTLGAGYDLGILYYPHDEDGNFLFHKGFAYINQNLTKKLSHRLGFEAGLKDYIDKKSLGDNLFTYQDKKRADKRVSGIYSITFLPSKKLSLGLLTKFSANQSNARYLDFYDYKSYEASPRIGYQLFEKVGLLLDFFYIRKNYDTRTVTLEDYKQKDNIYSSTFGTTYRLSSNNSVSFYYTFRKDDSNDPLADYTESVFSCGLQHKF